MSVYTVSSFTDPLVVNQHIKENPTRDLNNDYVPDPKGAEFLLKYLVPWEE